MATPLAPTHEREREFSGSDIKDKKTVRQKPGSVEADEKFFVNFSDCNELLAIVRLNELVEKEGRLGK